MRSPFALVPAARMLAALAFVGVVAGRAADGPAVFVLSGDDLARNRERVRAGDPALQPALEKLRADADAALTIPVASVMDKKLRAASGDPHDYFSMGPYWWPDPAKPDGLPYIRRDGDTNPQSRSGTDYQAFVRLVVGVETLGLAYYFTGHEPYAAHAAKLLRVWFLDPATRMNPHLNYAQAIPGHNDGRGIGIIETARMIPMTDSVILLRASPAWSETDDEGFTRWIGDYLEWMLTSANGRDEQDEANNHGTWYDAQVAQYALFSGRRDVAARVLREALQLRLATQIEPDGRQPHELRRTRSLNYCTMNLRGMLTLARQGRHVDVDWWQFATEDGRSLRPALEFLAPFADPAKPWIQDDITPGERSEVRNVIAIALARYDGGALDAAARVLAQPEHAPERWQLLTSRAWEKKSDRR